MCCYVRTHSCVRSDALRRSPRTRARSLFVKAAAGKQACVVMLHKSKSAHSRQEAPGHRLSCVPSDNLFICMPGPCMPDRAIRCALTCPARAFHEYATSFPVVLDTNSIGRCLALATWPPIASCRDPRLAYGVLNSSSPVEQCYRPRAIPLEHVQPSYVHTYLTSSTIPPTLHTGKHDQNQQKTIMRCANRATAEISKPASHKIRSFKIIQQASTVRTGAIRIHAPMSRQFR